jgi:hypothetical protein
MMIIFWGMILRVARANVLSFTGLTSVTGSMRIIRRCATGAVSSRGKALPRSVNA